MPGKRREFEVVFLRALEQLPHHGRHSGNRRDALALHEFERLVGVPLVHQREFGAHRARHIQPGQATDMEERERLQRHGLRRRIRRRLLRIGAGQASRDHRAEERVRQIGDVIAVRRERPFWPPGRARRVHDRRIVIRRDANVGQTVPIEVRPQRVVERLGIRRTHRIAYAEHDVERQLRQIRRDALHALAVEYRGARPGVLERVVQFVARPPRVQGHRDRADRLARPERQHPLGIIAHPDRDAIALMNAALDEQMRERTRAPLQLRVRPAFVVVDQKFAIGERRGRLEYCAHRRRRVRVDRHRNADDRLLLDLEWSAGPSVRMAPSRPVR